MAFTVLCRQAKQSHYMGETRCLNLNSRPFREVCHFLFTAGGSCGGTWNSLMVTNNNGVRLGLFVGKGVAWLAGL